MSLSHLLGMIGDDAEPSSEDRAAAFRHRVELTREVAFRFAVDPDPGVEAAMWRHAGAARYAWNKALGWVRHGLVCRDWERELGAEPWTEVPWTKFSLTPSTPGSTPGRPTRSTGAGAWPGKTRCARTSSSAPWSTSARPWPTGPSPAPANAKGNGSGSPSTRMRDAGRAHIYSVTFRFERGRWWLTLSGMAAAFHPARTSRKTRHSRPAGIDLGVRTLAVCADDTGEAVKSWEGVNALQGAQRKLRRANRRLARTKPGSAGRRRAAQQVGRLHRRVAGLRRQLTYKARWYGTALHEADRWFASSKTCSACRTKNDDLDLGDVTWTCPNPRCGAVHDRDHNAAVKLARWPRQQPEPPPARVAA